MTKEEIYNQLKILFHTHFLDLYTDLIQSVKWLFQYWDFDATNFVQRDFYALLFIFNQTSYCFNEKKALDSKNLIKFFNFFCFFWFDTTYLTWSAFMLSAFETNDNTLQKLHQLLFKINCYLINTVNSHLDEIVNLLKAYSKVSNLQDVFILDWEINWNDYTLNYPIHVLNYFLAKNDAFVDYYFKLEVNHTTNHVLDTTSLNKLLTKYSDTSKLKWDEQKSLTLKQQIINLIKQNHLE